MVEGFAESIVQLLLMPDKTAVAGIFTLLVDICKYLVSSNDSVPDPFVFRNWLAVPSEVGYAILAAVMLDAVIAPVLIAFVVVAPASVTESRSVVTLPNDSVPDPFVFRNCPDVPSDDGYARLFKLLAVRPATVTLFVVVFPLDVTACRVPTEVPVA